MKTINLDDHLENVARIKAKLGMIDSESETEAMRNKGEKRTPEKKELLKRTKERAKEAGKKPIKAYY